MSKPEYVVPIPVNVVSGKPRFHRIIEQSVVGSLGGGDGYHVGLKVEVDEEVCGLTTYLLGFYIPPFEATSSECPFKVFHLRRDPTDGFVLDYTVLETVQKTQEVQKFILQSK